MVLVSDKKYACETCIKGHRSSACKHTDRPLFEIKKKGRPVTQCDHCRELRKTKQVHVKCLCGLQEMFSHPASESSHSKKGATKLPAVAAFPHGLPEDLEAIAILPAVSDGSVDSDHSGETSPSGCRCMKGEQCDCSVPRKPAGRRRPSVHHQDVPRPERHHHHAESSHGAQDPPPPLSSHVLARIAELRPVLPRPPRNDGPLHDPSSSIPHSHSSRHHTHENMYFSPYGRAYEHIHSSDHYETKLNPQAGDTCALSARQHPPVQQNMLPGTQSGFEAWQASPGVFPSSCTCGDSCRCPGCSQHNSAPIAPGAAYSSCTNPASCSFCLDCTILSLPPSSAPPSNDSTSDYQTREFEEWLGQISASPTMANAVGTAAGFSPYELSMNPVAPLLPPNPNHNANSNSNLGPNPHSNHTGSSQHPASAGGRCHGRCNCPSGTCSCPAQCGGRYQGGECGQRRNDQSRSGSGDRNPSLNSVKPPDPGVIGSRRPGSQRVPDYMTMTTVRDGLTASVTNRPSPVGAGSGAGTTSFYSDPPNYLSPGDAPSRSSSSSSLSSRMSGRSPISANASGIFHAHGASNMGPGSRSPQPRPTPSTGTSAGGGVYAQPQPTRPLGSSPGQYALSAYAGLSSMQFLSQ
ncbi:hypothetical protein JVT61DRAFT_8174 [Boletus reticuloceps]|uniref:Copper-fist domain-containing protein n=1 Tax=Boletus reticuloceps TaxID=495285 RepID=A0A8I2YVJ9_9AGAM|nr:hypothetical protein JVT61DRAFT_8174 [Boletus reticuloceps]